MTDAAIVSRLDSLTKALVAALKATGTRMTRSEVCERIGVHRNTLADYMVSRGFPKPCRDGKWLLAEIVEWEAEK